MSYVTVEVEITDGIIVPVEPMELPEGGRGFLTIRPETEEYRADGSKVSEEEARQRMAAFHKLQCSLALTPEKAAAWKAAIREARR